MTRRRCCECGFDGPPLQGSRGELALRCPQCDADLYERPPRSYAELEGFVRKPAEAPPAPAPAATPASGLVPMLVWGAIGVLAVAAGLAVFVLATV